MAKSTIGDEQGTPIALYNEGHGAWQPVPALNDAGYGAIAYDRRGSDWSSQPWDGDDYDTFAADLNTLMKELDRREVAPVGFSMAARPCGLAAYGSGRVAGAVFAAVTISTTLIVPAPYNDNCGTSRT